MDGAVVRGGGADPDPVHRLRIIAAGLGTPSQAERQMDAPFDRVWAVASDLENELPKIIPGLRAFTVQESEGERLSALATSVVGHRERFSVLLRSGWCLMQSRVLTSGMAAVPEGDRTRFAYFTALRIPGAALVDRLRPPGRRTRGALLLDRLEQRVGERARLPGGPTDRE